MRHSERKSALVAALLLVALCVLLVETYRPWIYENHLFDFHLADTLTSWICVPAASLFFWGVSRASFRDCLAGSLTGLVLYEFVGLVFDWFDLLALLLSAVITYSIYCIYKK